MLRLMMLSNQQQQVLRQQQPEGPPREGGGGDGGGGEGYEDRTLTEEEKTLLHRKWVEEEEKREAALAEAELEKMWANKVKDEWRAENLQLADVDRPEQSVLQVGKLGDDHFNVDLNGCASPLQAFATALAVFDQSSMRRRF